MPRSLARNAAIRRMTARFARMAVATWGLVAIAAWAAAWSAAKLSLPPSM